jgi:hypothetical protein
VGGEGRERERSCEGGGKRTRRSGRLLAALRGVDEAAHWFGCVSLCLVYVSLPMHLLRCGLERRGEERSRETVRCRVIWYVALSDDVCACVSSLSAFRMAVHGNRWSGSVLFVLVVLTCFPTGVEGGPCSISGSNVIAENMGACNTCEANCSGTYCDLGCAWFYNSYDLLVLQREGTLSYPTLSSCKDRCSDSKGRTRWGDDGCKAGCDKAYATPEGKAWAAAVAAFVPTCGKTTYGGAAFSLDGITHCVGVGNRTADNRVYDATKAAATTPNDANCCKYTACVAGTTFSASGNAPCKPCSCVSPSAECPCEFYSRECCKFKTACTKTSDTVCHAAPDACVAGSTFSTSGHAPCKTCAAVSSCSAGVKTACDTTTDTACNVPCEAGKSFSTSGYTPCTTCAVVDEAVCTANCRWDYTGAVCTAGIKTACTTTTDTACNVSTVSLLLVCSIKDHFLLKVMLLNLIFTRYTTILPTHTPSLFLRTPNTTLANLQYIPSYSLRSPYSKRPAGTLPPPAWWAWWWPRRWRRPRCAYRKGKGRDNNQRPDDNTGDPWAGGTEII